MSRTNKIRIFYFCALVLMFALGFIPAIPQDLAYHNFSDQRSMFGIPHFWNVISNVPFVVIGLWALMDLHLRKRAVLDAQLAVFIYIFLIGFVLTGLGSAFYHWSPNNSTLVWDRLPMTIAFMSFFAMMLALHIDINTGKRALIPLIALGAFSVFYWHYTEQHLRGDLRLYAAVQFAPMLLLPLLVCTLPTNGYRLRYLLWLAVAYLSAKLFEHFDNEIHALIFMSGHAIKHVVASLAGIAFYLLVLAPDARVQKQSS